MKLEIRRGNKKALLLLLSFLLPLAVMLAVMVHFEVEPFGDRSLVIIDGLHQYMPFFSVLYDKLKSGEGLFYSFRGGLGVNFLSLFAYYLSSPLNLLILLFGKSQLNMAVSFLIALKIALSGLTAGIYFTAKKKNPGVSVLFLAMAYALNSYMVGYCWNVMWLDAILILPIVILGLERLVEKRDGRLYCAALFYALYCNYYIAFMICIFAVLWYLLYSFENVRQFFCRGVAFAAWSFLAAGMAAALLIPAYLGIKETGSGETMTLPAHSFLTGFADLLTRQFDLASPISHDNFDGNANLYIGMFTVLLALLYFLNREIRWVEKGKKALLLAFFIVSFNEEILNFIWHGFHNQYGIPNRFSFLFGFVLLAMAAEVTEHLDGLRPWRIALGVLLGAGLLYLSRSLAETPLDDETYGIVGGLLLFYALALLVACLDRKRRKWYLAVFTLAAVAEIAATAMMGFDQNGQISVSKFFYGTEDMETAADETDDGTFFRSELANSLMVDESTWYRLNAVGLFGSTVRDDMVTMMDSLGFYTGCNEYLYKGATPVTNLLLGVRYLYFHAEDGLATEFTYAGSYGSFDCYENPTEGLSVGYMMDADIGSWYYESAYPFRVLNELCQLGYGVENVFSPIEITDPLVRGCSASRTNDGEYYFEFDEADAENMLFTITPETDLECLYIFYDGTQVQNAQVAVDGAIVKSGDIDGYIHRIGAVSAGSTVTVAFELKGETDSGYVRLSAADFGSAQYETLVERMTGQAFEVTKAKYNGFEGTVNASDGQVLFFSIPYDEGWSVTVDGEEAKTLAVGNAFLAVEMEAGEHTVSLSYVSPGFRQGIAISAASVLLFLLLCAFAPRYRAARERREERRERLREERRREREDAQKEITNTADRGNIL